MVSITLRSKNNQPIDDLVLSALEAEKRELLTAIAKTELKLKDFESKHHTSTETFLTQALQLPHLEATEWLGESETRKRLKEKLSRLEDIQVCT